jgi:hypothetical protein
MLSGYQFTQGFAAANMSRLRVAIAQEANRKTAVLEGEHTTQVL